MAENAIIDKVRGLLRKTEAAGCTPEESDAAMRLAARLMAKHNIDRVVVENKEAEEAMRGRLDLVKEYVNTGRDKCYTDEHIMRILRQCFCLKVFYTTTWDSKEYEADKAKYYEKTEACKKARAKYPNNSEKWPSYPRWPNMKERFTYVLVGDKPDVEMAAALIGEFRRIMRHGLAAHLRETGETWNVVVADSYHAGFAAGYIDTNAVAVKEAMLEAGEAAADQYALAVVDKEKAVEQFAAENVHTVRARANSGNGARSWGFNERAAKKGRDTGKNLNLKGKRLQ